MGGRLTMRSAAPVIAAILLTACPACAAQPRIASMNVCTDQLLLSLADPGQIVGLSRYARDDWQSWRAAEAQKFPVLSGGAEDILVLKPDVVVASLFDKRATRELLQANGVQLAEFSVPRTMDEVKAQIVRMGEITGQAERANAEVGRIDAAIQRARETLGQRNGRVLPLSRRGWVAGRDSLLGVLLREAGLRNAADELGIGDGAFISLEGILALKPDVLLLSEAGDRAEDEGRAFLLHPALARFYPPDQLIVIPDRLTVCGGVMLAEALDLLVSEMKRIGK
ncbi:iron ABC transporter [Bradyrhizobium guangdongense]|uniref:ABC transporter substrate-binding protein n=1 Tax=Bradyrhizobium guangdongense TaxID=1325090 RepID=UPI001127D266|nr:ABC transporter substrate-binding protein [Bradyrhizobium guangdongense]TPQ40053.1 iron ABC transporter [Bradyrhizobium guangdongense]